MRRQALATILLTGALSGTGAASGAAASTAAVPISRVSVSSSGAQSNGMSRFPSISGGGRHVVFYSEASDLAQNGATNSQIYLRDRSTNTTRLVSVSSTGVPSNGFDGTAAISADSRYVVFSSDATNLVPHDTNNTMDVFVRDVVTGTTKRVSVASNGGQGNGDSGMNAYGLPGLAISADGRYVAFASDATNLVPGDTNKSSDVFVHDVATNVTRRISVSSDGTQGAAGSYDPVISANGQLVAFDSFAGNLVSGDTNADADVFVHSMVTGVTQRVSVTSTGAQGEGLDPSISANGRYVAFLSYAPSLVSKGNIFSQVLVHDLADGTTRLVSASKSGVAGNDDSYDPSISADGSYVAFDSDASNLAPRDSNNSADVLVRDLKSGALRLVSESPTGAPANGNSYDPSISPDGRFIAFASDASNLTPNDTNQTSDVFVGELPKP